MTATSSLTAADLVPGRSVVFRNATVLTLNDAHDVLDGATSWSLVSASPR
jgi:hypothetical protein